MGNFKIYFNSRSHKVSLARIINKALNDNKVVEIYPQDSEAFIKVGETIASINKECKIQTEGEQTKYVLTPNFR